MFTGKKPLPIYRYFVYVNNEKEPILVEAGYYVKNTDTIVFVSTNGVDVAMFKKDVVRYILLK